MKSKSFWRWGIIGVLLLHSTPFAIRPTASTQVLGGAEIVGTCPSGCKLVTDITNIRTEESVEGVRVSINWATAQLPADIKLLSFNVSAKLVLKDNKTVESDPVNVTAPAGFTVVLVRGRIFNRNINLSDIKSGSATVKASAMTTSNPTVNVTSKEIVGNDGAEVNMLVKWTAPPAGSPCLAERMVNVSASAENAGGIKFEGSTSVKLSANSATVRLRGVGLRRKEMKNLKANLNVLAVVLTCGRAKSIQSFGNGTGSNP